MENSIEMSVNTVIPTKRVSDRVPLFMKPYTQLARLDIYPSGTLLMFWPSAWALTMASLAPGTPPRTLAHWLVYFLVWNSLAHSAGCVVNDIVDVDIDRKIERTKIRPLPSGRVSLAAAWTFYFVLAAVCACMLVANKPAFSLGLIALGPLYVLYPVMKRITYWPQAWLGLAIAWSLPIAWTTVDTTVDWRLLAVLIVGIVCWSVVFDTMHALLDKAEDIRTGVKSTAVLFGDYVKLVLSVFAAGFVATLAFAGVWNKQSPAFFVVSVGGSAIHLTWQLSTLNVDEPADCWNKFVRNGDLGLIVWLGTLIDYVTAVMI